MAGRSLRIGGLVAVDILAVNQSIWAAFALDQLFIRLNTLDIVVACTIYLLILHRFKAYTSLWEKASIDELLQLSFGIIIASALIHFYIYLAHGSFSVEAFAIKTTALLITSGGFRFAYRVIRRISRSGPFAVGAVGKGERERTLIIGAGDTGRMVLKDIAEGNTSGYKPVALIDDDPSKHGLHLHGVRIIGGRNLIATAVEKYKANTIIVAIPSASHREQGEILKICSQTGRKVRVVPGMIDMLTGKLDVGKIRDIRIEDLLGREAVLLNDKGINEMLEGSTVLVTGGAGSIGSELVRQCIRYNPKRIIVLDLAENRMYMLANEIRMTGAACELVTLVGSVRDAGRLDVVFSKYKPDIVFHAAAHKHVPLMEDSPSEAVKNNIMGTYLTARASAKHGAKNFIFISTDKAVNPTSIMGASKRFSEMIIDRLKDKGRTKFASVRFGNVLGSDGSVVPIFRKQIEAGGPVTVTHPDITRYFMLVSEAVQLVLQAASMTVGDELFVLDMGTPVKIADMARDLIRLNGLEPDKDIKIVYTGLRPGEKMYEELFYSKGNVNGTMHSKVFVAKRTPHVPNDIFERMDMLYALAREEREQDLVRVLMESVNHRDPIVGSSDALPVVTLPKPAPASASVAKGVSRIS